MNSCLYGNGTSFVESLFEDFGRLTSTVASKSFNHYILFFHCTARKNANESVNRIQLCVISTVCPSTRLQFAHAQCVSCGAERGGRGGEGGGDSSQQVCECFRSASVGRLSACRSHTDTSVQLSPQTPTDTPPPLPTTPLPDDYYEEAVPLDPGSTPQYFTTNMSSCVPNSNAG